METTYPKHFRTHLKAFLDKASKTPLRIQRRSQGSLILLSEDTYNEMTKEILALQRKLLGLPVFVSEKTKRYRHRSPPRKSK